MQVFAKIIRSEDFYRFTYGMVDNYCIACNGSGYYDHNGSPPCGSCEGTGREKREGDKHKTLHSKAKAMKEGLEKQYNGDLNAIAKAVITLTNNHFQVSTLKDFSNGDLQTLINASLFYLAEKEINTDKTIKAYYGEEKQY